jgi:hypothetical protein
MIKEIYLFRGDPGTDYQAFRESMLGLSGAVLAESNPFALKITLTVKRPPGVSVIPFRRDKVAAISILRNSYGKPGSLINGPGFIGGYRVKEAIPVAYEKTWEDRAATPGVCLLTLFHRRPDLDQEVFLRRWYGSHTPLSLRLHPLWNYNRNAVIGMLTEDSTRYDGIVEEQFRAAADLLNPVKFFGPPIRVPLHMYQVLKDTRSFIDMKRIETYLAEEYHIKSPG